MTFWKFKTFNARGALILGFYSRNVTWLDLSQEEKMTIFTLKGAFVKTIKNLKYIQVLRLRKYLYVWNTRKKIYLFFRKSDKNPFWSIPEMFSSKMSHLFWISRWADCPITGPHWCAHLAYAFDRGNNRKIISYAKWVFWKKNSTEM